ncbi:MAG: hypothetical protein D6727_04100 [Gammaproteobacteria bacterium]|nr:MAG: hypothetical protein D6727_04100 [Gammaproteobacteria bacterium]
MSSLCRLAIPLAVMLLTACAASRTVQYEQVQMLRAETELPSEALLDVGILLFDPGVPEDAQAPDGLVFPEVRRAEARYLPVHLKKTLEASGQWGSVWVLPERSDAVDLLVWARIDESDGLEVELRVGAWDATGREWLNKAYETQVPEKAYSSYRDLSQDPYQNVFNEIANDLVAARARLDSGELRRIGEVAELRFGAELVPAAFSDYLAENDGRYQLLRLPAVDDPMVARMRAVREREYSLIDTLNEYYDGLYYELSKPYEDWRRMSRSEMLQYRDLKRSARIRQLLGLAAILGAVAYESEGGGNSAITTTAIIGGVEGLKSGFGKSAEANLRRDTLEELGTSFESEAKPLVVEVEGQTRRLTGTAEEKYREWRRLLHEIYASETGLISLNDAPGDAGQVSN